MDKDIFEQFREKIKEDFSPNKPKRTLEDALKEALDNTTPEEAGVPKPKKPEEIQNEWL